MKIDPERILVIAPHSDDESVACGGTVSRFVREGREVHVLVLASASALEPDIPLNECTIASSVLNVKLHSEDRFPVRYFTEYRQVILDTFLDIRKQLKPDLVIIPSLRDMHQDHQVAAQEGLRAFKNHSTILGFTYGWNLISFDTTCFIEFTEADLERKIEAISCYVSQDKAYMKPEAIRACAVAQGLAINARYAESYEVYRLVL